ncbi:hypothetical protein A2153_02535 [Candidatus Gottesmanbacteria bacterium RBG_16_38_7b]|uniref:Peptidase S9 prolyl oligopeptidase catalytic domain-containing protein n=1 Tax=Candidatus Gottesmanbacteria bacterium RBG_16_38_7b TaxID=1798372 RepID=A0A1F5YL44_9BACT|nr:MAG: hypothetical protein A2153_02535 [Candidatus Gottesmanbacteria bacterium RBG_16_38_7b]
MSGLRLIGYQFRLSKLKIISPVVYQVEVKERALDHYSIENLKNTRFSPQEIILADQNLFYFKSDSASVSGLINLPDNLPPQGIIVLLRGYVDREIYTTGTGTKRIGEYLSSNGFITLAPDFLGYGQSSSPSAFPLAERFQTYTTTLQLLASLPNLPSSVKKIYPDFNFDFDPAKIGLFGHSNGGHIAVAVLEITGQNYPTVLWAPVSKPFPYSVLYYTDEFEDQGKALRKIISDFERNYQSEKYSITEYFDLINAPLSIHQGLNDQEVPYWWSDELVKILKEKNKNAVYFTYPGENHNFNGGSWITLAAHTRNFYRQNFPIP